MKKFYQKVNMVRSLLKACLAEFIGTMVFVFITTSNGNLKDGCWYNSSIKEGLALFLGILISSSASGGHLNPAITFGLASIGKFPWKRVIPYIVSQYFGAFFGTLLFYFCYLDLMDKAEVFINNALIDYSIYMASFKNCIGTAILVLTVSVIVNQKNVDQSWFYPMAGGLAYSSIMSAFINSNGLSFNPAADLSPKIFSAIIGFSELTWKYDEAVITMGAIAPHVGGLFGAFLYHLLLGFNTNRNT